MIKLRPLDFAFLFLVLCVHQITSIDSKWYSTTLQVLDSSSTFSDRAVAVAPVRDGSFLVAGERTQNSARGTHPFLCKVTLLGEVIWERTITSVEGNLYGLAVDEDADKAYVVVSSHPSPTSSFSSGFLVAIENLSSKGTHDKTLDNSGEHIHFSARSPDGNTKLFGCVIDNRTGDIFVTGGSTGSIYGPRQGRSDVIAARISTSGSVLAKVQFGTANDEFGRAIEVSADSAVIAIAVHRMLDSGGTEAVLYQLDAETLTILSGPMTLVSYGTTPLFTPSDVTIYGPTSLEPGVMTIAITGGALTVPDRKTDVFLHLYSMMRETTSRFPIYIDGAEKKKEDDFAVSAMAAKTGNIYVLGYSRSSSPAVRHSLTLFVIAPTGKILHESVRKISENTSREDIPAGMTMTQRDGQMTVVFVGHSHVVDRTQSLLGTVLPPSNIPPFLGFGGVAEEAGTDPGPKPEPVQEEENSKKIVPVLTVSVIAGLAALIGISAIAYLRIQRNGNKGRNSETTEPERHRVQGNSVINAAGPNSSQPTIHRHSALV